jgi:outer membrane cobalamin receptor
MILADSAAVAVDSAAALTDSAGAGADSLTALPDSAGVDSTGVALPDTSRITLGAPMRFYDPSPGARISPFSGKSAKRDREDFLSLSTTTSGEAFAFEPGIGLLESGSAGLRQVLRVRGSRPGDVRYLLDGIPVTDDRIEFFTANDLNWLPLAGMEGAEVAKNGQSGLFGSGATGGVLNLRSMSAMPRVPTSEVVAWWSSFDSRAVHFRFNRRITSTFGIVLAYENLHSGGWIESSTANSNKFYGKLTGFIGRGLAYDVVGYRYDGSTESPDSCADSPYTGPIDHDDKRDLLAVSITSLSDLSVRLDYHYLGTERQLSDGDERPSGEGRTDGVSAVTAWATQDSLYAEIGAGFKRHALEYSRYEGHVDEVSTTDIYGYMASEKPLDAWRFRGSLRLERNSLNSTEFGGDLGASFKAAPWCMLTGRVDRSFAFPALGECVEWSGCSKDVAQHWNGAELGAEFSLDRARLSATGFYRKADRTDVWYRDEDCNSTYLREEDITYVGGELLLDVSLVSWLTGSLGYSIARSTSVDGVDLTYYPPWDFTWDLRISRKFSCHVSAGATFAGRWVSSTDVGNRLDTCSGTGCIQDARLDGFVSGLLYGYIEIDSGRVYARVRNLFNQGITQVWGHPELPSRSYEFGVNLELFD